MKLTHKLCAATLLAVLGAAVAVPNAVQAAETETTTGNPLSFNGQGSIKFLEDDSVDLPTIPGGGGNTDPENPIVNPPINPATGPLKVVAVTDLDFGNDNKVTPASGNGWEYTAKAAVLEQKDGTQTTAPNFVQFKDTRADNKANKHTLTAKATTFTNGENQELKSATLQFNNIKLVNEADQTQVTSAEGAVPTTQNLVTDGQTPTTFVSQKEDDKGFGQFTLQFGDTTDNTAADSVKLLIQAQGNKLSTTSSYTSTITWTIADAR